MCSQSYSPKLCINLAVAESSPIRFSEPLRDDEICEHQSWKPVFICVNILITFCHGYIDIGKAVNGACSCLCNLCWKFDVTSKHAHCTVAGSFLVIIITLVRCQSVQTPKQLYYIRTQKITPLFWKARYFHSNCHPLILLACVSFHAKTLKMFIIFCQQWIDVW